ncbi:hypothetical protein [Streptomyces nodosus]|uniref:hypothetical protein n=1 Tax=Streptomyces nodosus TaxID=40318 RepID=UPI0037F93DC9
MAEVVVLPGPAVRGGPGGDGVAADEDFDGADAAGEVAGVRWPSHSWSSNRGMGSFSAHMRVPFCIGGGVDTPTLVGAIERAWNESYPARVLTSLGEGDQCGPDGVCAI